VVMKRRDGLLLAMPQQYLPASVLQRATAEEDFIFGPHTKFVVPSAKVAEEDAGEVVDLLLGPLSYI